MAENEPASARDAAPRGVHVGFAMPSGASDAQFDFFARHFNLLGMENAGKPSQIYRGGDDTGASYRNAPDWSDADALITAAAGRGVGNFVLHTPYWPVQPTENVDLGEASSLRDLELRVEKVLNDYIRKFSSKPGLVQTDLVNEIVDGSLDGERFGFNARGGLASTSWRLGADQDDYWYHVIDHVGGRLGEIGINDYSWGGSSGFQKQAFDRYQEIITELDANGRAIDFLGIQGHLLADRDVAYEREQLALEMLWLENAYAIKPSITELDHEQTGKAAQEELNLFVSTILEFSRADLVMAWNAKPGRTGVIDIEGMETTPLYEPLVDALEAALPVGQRDIPELIPFSLRFKTPLLFERSERGVANTGEGMRLTSEGAFVAADFDLFKAQETNWSLEFRGQFRSARIEDGAPVLTLAGPDGKIEILYDAQANSLALGLEHKDRVLVDRLVADEPLPARNDIVAFKLARAGGTIRLVVMDGEVLEVTPGPLPAIETIHIATDENGRNANTALITRWLGVDPDGESRAEFPAYLDVGDLALADPVAPAVTPTRSPPPPPPPPSSPPPDPAPMRQLDGTPGNDRLKGSSADDMITAFAGKDRLVGKAGDDQLDGGRGNDRIKGGEGEDTLIGGPGNDRLNGGEGRDVLVIEPGSGKDRIKFVVAEDVLDIDAYRLGFADLDTSSDGRLSSADAFTSGKTAKLTIDLGAASGGEADTDLLVLKLDGTLDAANFL